MIRQVGEYQDWGKLNPWHVDAARDLVRLMGTVDQVAVLRDAAEYDREQIAVVRDMATRLAEELPR